MAKNDKNKGAKKEVEEEVIDTGIKAEVEETEETTDESKKNSKKTENANRKVVVWLKNTSYINDTQRLDAGVYPMDEVPHRLKISGKRDVEIFENGIIPSKKLNQIGEFCGLKHPEDMEDEEILAKIISTPQPYN